MLEIDVYLDEVDPVDPTPDSVVEAACHEQASQKIDDETLVLTGVLSGTLLLAFAAAALLKRY